MGVAATWETNPPHALPVDPCDRYHAGCRGAARFEVTIRRLGHTETAPRRLCGVCAMDAAVGYLRPGQTATVTRTETT